MIAEVDMPNLTDRRRLKDRIIESIGRAIRHIQDLQSRSEDGTVILTNSEWQLHKLVEHLDHAFLHGLRHITNGYWVAVQEFTNKTTIKDINRMFNVTTNLGKGRAWLYQALNDQLLESYTQCFLDNQKLIKKFYVKEAMVLDDQRMHLLLTLASGLEMIYFQLEVDVPYLDLASHMKQRSSESEESEDRISLSSMESSISQGTPDYVDECLSSLQHRASLSTIYGHSPSQKKSLQASMSLPLLEATHINHMTSQVTAFGNIMHHEEEKSPTNTDIEVIHMPSKGAKTKRKKVRKQMSENNLESFGRSDAACCDDDKLIPSSSGFSSVTITPTTPESGYRSVVENRCSSQQDSASEISVTLEDCVKDLKALDTTDSSVECAVNTGQKQPDNDRVNDSDSNSATKDNNLEFCNHVQVQVLRDLNWTPKELEIMESLEADTLQNKENMDTQQTVNVNMESGCSSNSLNDPNSSEKTQGKTNSAKADSGLSQAENNVQPVNQDSLDVNFPQIICEQSIYDDGASYSSETSPTDLTDAISITSASTPESSQNANAHEDIVQVSSSRRPRKSTGSTKKTKIAAKRKKDHDAEVLVDINLALMINLEVFEVEEEKLIKMYQTCIGHTEGDLVPIYLLITDSAIYLLTTKYGQKKFHKEGVTKFRELDYISLSLNFQVINIVCTNRRKQFWITTGDDQLTRCIVTNLEKSIKYNTKAPTPLIVLTDATTQKIAINKWIASETNTEMPAVNIDRYTLVHWDDMSSDDKSVGPIATNREGVLWCKTPGTVYGTYWKQAFFVLKDGFLYQYSDRHDNQPPRVCIQLNQEDCVGCRRSRQPDREHCFDVILSTGTALELSGGTERDTREWLQCLCQAVSQGMGMPVPSSGVLPCSSVLTKTHVFMFHEDLQTNFCRTLGSAPLTDLVHVLVDPGAQIYLVLCFESPVSPSLNRRWVVYYNTMAERDSFISALSSAWGRHFHVTLPSRTLDDVSLQTRCRSNIARLKKQRRV